MATFFSLNSQKERTNERKKHFMKRQQMTVRNLNTTFNDLEIIFPFLCARNAHFLRTISFKI